MRPFRFAVTMPPPRPPLAEWRDSLRRIEDLGVDTIVAADHFTQGYEFEPIVALTAAAGATIRLRLQTGVLGNDYRHPVLVHRMAALLDVISDGRLVLGLGAGWMTTDYEGAGIALDPPGTRVDRLEESIEVVKGLFAAEPCTFKGSHYQVSGLDGLPKPVQQPHPPFFIGGGSPRVLRLAGREADIVGINASLAAGELGAHAIRDLSQERVNEKVAWVRDGAARAGRTSADVELEINQWLARITPTPAAATEFLARVGVQYDVDPAILAASPSVLVGTVEQCIDQLLERRERLGLSYIQLDAGFPTPNQEAFGPVIAALGGS